MPNESILQDNQTLNLITQYNNDMVKITMEHPKVLSHVSIRSKTNIDIGMSSDNNDQIKEREYVPSSERGGLDGDDYYRPG